jgi:hypothetical protein
MNSERFFFTANIILDRPLILADLSGNVPIYVDFTLIAQGTTTLPKDTIIDKGY